MSVSVTACTAIPKLRVRSMTLRRMTIVCTPSYDAYANSPAPQSPLAFGAMSRMALSRISMFATGAEIPISVAFSIKLPSSRSEVAPRATTPGAAVSWIHAPAITTSPASLTITFPPLTAMWCICAGASTRNAVPAAVISTSLAHTPQSCTALSMNTLSP